MERSQYLEGFIFAWSGIFVRDQKALSGMKFQPTTVRLKNDRTILLRMAQIEDDDSLRLTIHAYLKSSPYVPLTPEEFTPSLEEEETWIQQFIDQCTLTRLGHFA